MGKTSRLKLFLQLPTKAAPTLVAVTPYASRSLTIIILKAIYFRFFSFKPMFIRMLIDKHAVNIPLPIIALYCLPLALT